MVLGLVSGVGLLFGAISSLAVLCSTGLREVQKQYDPIPTEPVDSDTDNGSLMAQDTEELRGWRDLFKPWDDR